MAKTNTGSYYLEDGVGTNDNDILFTTDEVSNFNAFFLLGSAGAVDVEVQLIENGTWSTAPVSLQDLGATGVNPVLVTAANRLYSLLGNFHKIRVRQNGAVAAIYVLRAWRHGN